MNLSGPEAIRAVLKFFGPKCSRDESARRYSSGCRACPNFTLHPITVRGHRHDLEWCGRPLTKDPTTSPPQCGCVVGRSGRPEGKTRAKFESCPGWNI